MSDFLEEKYVRPLLEQGYIEIDYIDLPDGVYVAVGMGYKYEIHGLSAGPSVGRSYNDSPTGYIVVTNEGTRGMYRELIRILKGDVMDSLNDNTKIDLNCYKIFTNKKSIVRDYKLEKMGI
jgi:hypothetical protein